MTRPQGAGKTPGMGMPSTTHTSVGNSSSPDGNTTGCGMTDNDSNSDGELRIDQHIVSKCLIHCWSRTGKDPVQYFDLRNGPRFKTAAPAQIMYRTADGKGDGFVPVEFAISLEQEWSQVEKRGCEAIRAVLGGGSVDDDRRTAIRGLMALHLLRSSETLGRFLMIVGDKATELHAEVATSDDYRRVLVETGMTVEEAQEAADAAIRSPDGFVQGARADLAGNMTRWLERFVEALSAGGLLLRKSDTDTLVLGDGPAFLSPGDCLTCETTVMFGKLDEVHRCARHTGFSAHWPAADWLCWMPLAPQLLAVAGPRIKDADTPLPLVGSMSDRVNVMQCRRAQVRIVIPPDGANRYRPVIDTHASYKPPISGYLPEQPPEDARWKM